MKLKGLICILSLTATLSACKKNCTDCWTIPPVENTYFKVVKNNVPLNDSILSKTIMYYINKNGKIITDPDKTELNTSGNDGDDSLFMYLVYDYYSDHPAEFKNSHIAMFATPTMISAQTDIHDFYLKYPDGDIDTLFINAEEVSNEQGKKEQCYCTMPVRELKFNGKDVITDTSFHLSTGQSVYLFEK